jgi:hypothetical protein
MMCGNEREDCDFDGWAMMEEVMGMVGTCLEGFAIFVDVEC